MCRLYPHDLFYVSFYVLQLYTFQYHAWTWKNHILLYIYSFYTVNPFSPNLSLCPSFRNAGISFDNANQSDITIYHANVHIAKNTSEDINAKLFQKEIVYHLFSLYNMFCWKIIRLVNY